MPAEKVLIQRGVVVVVMAACIRTRTEGHSPVAGPIISHVFMTMPAVVNRDGDSHGVSSFFLMFNMTRQAVLSVELLQQHRFRGIDELPGGMGISRLFQVFTVTVDA